MTAPTTIDGDMMKLTEQQILDMVATRGRAEGSIWKFDELGISLLINDIARALLSASKPAAPQEYFYETYTGQCGWLVVSKEEYENAEYRKRRTPLAASPAAPAQSGGVAPLSVMRAAFRVTEAEGNPDPKKQRFHMRFIFRSMDELHAADDQWRIFSNAAPQPSQPVEAGEAKRFPTPISISTDKICEIAGKYNLGNPRLDALRCFVNEIIIVNEAEYAKSE
jgi:hypothetical protein